MPRAFRSWRNYSTPPRHRCYPEPCFVVYTRQSGTELMDISKLIIDIIRTGLLLIDKDVVVTPRQ